MEEERGAQNEGQEAKEINLIRTSAEQLEQITPITRERCAEELCGPAALSTSLHTCV